MLIVFIMAGVNGALDIYMFQYFWELDGGEMLNVNLAPIVGLLVGAFLAGPLMRRTGKLFGVLLGTAAWAACQVIPVVCRLLDAFPANGTAELFYTLVAFKFVQGLILQQAFIGFGSMMADVATSTELESGTRQEASSSAPRLSSKATRLRTFLGGLGLDIIDWPAAPTSCRRRTCRGDAGGLLPA